MTTHRDYACNLRVGDVILLYNGTYKARITFIALVRGLEIEIKYRSADWMHRSTTEHCMVVPKYTILTVED